MKVSRVNRVQGLRFKAYRVQELGNAQQGLVFVWGFGLGVQGFRLKGSEKGVSGEKVYNLELEGSGFGASS